MIARDAAHALHQPGGDIVDLLRFQHRRIDKALTAVDRATSGDRVAAFDRLQAMFRIHELGEQHTIHPALANLPARRWRAPELVDQEAAATAKLSALRALGCDHADFPMAFSQLAASIREHIAREEDEEHPALRAALTVERLRQLANYLRSVQAML